MTDDGTREAFDGAACGLLVLDERGRTRRANRLIGEWSGAAPDVLVGKPFQDLFSIGSKLFMQTQGWPLLEMQGSIAEVQLELVRPGESPLPVLVNAVRRADRSIDVAVFVAADRRKYERELLHARRRAEELLETVALREAELRERAAFAEQLIGIVSHDLRNPLNAILLGTHLLSSSDPAARDATAKRIVNATRRATRLTSELLDFTNARLGKGIPVARAPIDIHVVVAATVEEIELAWPGRRVVHMREGAGLASADEDRLAQVVTNLVSNAMTYGLREEPITVTSIVGADTLTIRVFNRGRPIAPELLDLIFQPLQRGEDQVQRGSRSVGLGLYIVREIAHAHGGEARVTSTEDGTTFEVVAPSK